MAAGPYKGKGGNYYIVWSDKRAYPDQPVKTEQLQTKKIGEARQRKLRLEELYGAGKHNVWDGRWYDNPSLRNFVKSGFLGKDVSSIRRAGQSVTLLEAVELYISWQINRPSGWNSDRTIQKNGNRLRLLSRLIGDGRYVSAVTVDQVHAAIYRKDSKSPHTQHSDRTVWNAFSSYCLEKGWITKKHSIETPARTKSLPVYIHADQLTAVSLCKLIDVEMDIECKYVNHETQIRYVLAWQLMAGTGLRPSEASQITLSDVDQLNGIIKVGIGFDTKTRSQRIVPILYQARGAVSVLTDPEFRRKDSALAQTSRLLGVNSDSVQKRVSSELKRCWKIVYPLEQPRTAYHLRDTYAVRYLSDENGSNRDFRLLQLRNNLGHSSITTTEKYLKSVPGKINLSPDRGVDWRKQIDDIRKKLTEIRT